MTEVIVVELPGNPVGKGRPRFRTVTTTAGRSFVTAYTPAKTRHYSEDLAWAAKIAMKGRKPLLGPLKANVTAFFAVPPSWTMRKRDAALAGSVFPTGRPDCDNVQKEAWDALNGIVFADDAQIVKAEVSKIYAEQPKLRIEIRTLEPFGEWRR